MVHVGGYRSDFRLDLGIHTPGSVFLVQHVDVRHVIEAVDPDGEHSTPRAILLEFLEWMVPHESAYDTDGELAEDLESVAEDSQSWAWVARHDGDPAGCVLLHGESESLADFAVCGSDRRIEGWGSAVF